MNLPKILVASLSIGFFGLGFTWMVQEGLLFMIHCGIEGLMLRRSEYLIEACGYMG
jgi:hypothetical protein